MKSKVSIFPFLPALNLNSSFKVGLEKQLVQNCRGSIKLSHGKAEVNLRRLVNVPDTPCVRKFQRNTLLSRSQKSG